MNQLETLKHIKLTAMLILALFAIGASRAQAPATTPDSIATTLRLRALIDTAINSHAPSVTIPPGTYRLGLPAGSVSFLNVEDAHDLTIAGEGVHLICTYRTRAISIDRCSNVTLTGLSVDYDPLPFTQGDIVAIADDKSSIDVKIHDGYPLEANSRIDIVDPKTRYRKHGMPFLWGTKAELIAPDVVRVSLNGIGNAAVVGDMASLSRYCDPGGIPHAIALGECSKTTLRNVTVYASPSMGIVEFEGDGGSHFDHCQVIPGPRPVGATQDRLLSTSNDAMMCSSMKVGPLVENCLIRSAGDDSWSIQSGDYKVINPQGTTLVLGYGDSWTDGVQVGDRLRETLDTPVATVLTRQWVSGDPAWPKAAKYLQVTLDHDLGEQAGDRVIDQDRMGNGFIFRNNRLHSSGRVLIKAGGLVENNTLDTPHAMDVCPETASPGVVENLTIRGNTIMDSGYFCPGPWSSQSGALSITTGGSNGVLKQQAAFDNVTIEGNTFIGIAGPNIVVASARNVSIHDNRFLDPQQTKPPTTGADYGIDRSSVLYIAQSDHVALAANYVKNPGTFLSKVLSIGPGVTNLTGPPPVVVSASANAH